MALADFLKTINQTGGVNPQQSPIGQSNPSMQTSSTPSPFGDMSQKLEGKNDKLKLMLYALGGALKGDKDFVQNTLALQNIQEGKKKQEAQKKKYEEFLAKLPEGSFKDLATTLGPSKLDDLLLERYKAETKEPKERKTLQDPEGYYRYLDTGERVFPGIVKPEKEKSPSQLISKQELDVLNKIKSLQDQVDAGTLILEEGEQITDKLNQQQDSFAAFTQFLSGQNDDDLIIKKVE
jgi:hypothetical protein